MQREPKKMKSMYEVAKMAILVEKFTSRLRNPQPLFLDRDLMRRQFIEATTSPPGAKYYVAAAAYKKPKKVKQVAYQEEGAEMLEEEIEDDDDEALTISDDEPEDVDPNNMDYYQRRRKELEEFYKKLLYGYHPPPKASQRTEELAKPKKHFLMSMYEEYGKNFEPLRRKRIKRKVKEFKKMTTEELEQKIREEQAKKKDNAKIYKKRQRVYYRMLNKLERQVKTKFLYGLFKDFSNYLADCAVGMENVTEICPANVKSLIDVIQHNIYQTCKIARDEQQINGSLYRSISTCIAWLVVDVLYSAQALQEYQVFETASASNVPQQVKNDSTELEKILRKRARIAAKRKLPISKADKGLYDGPPPKVEEIIKLANLIGAR